MAKKQDAEAGQAGSHPQEREAARRDPQEPGRKEDGRRDAAHRGAQAGGRKHSRQRRRLHRPAARSAGGAHALGGAPRGACNVLRLLRVSLGGEGGESVTTSSAPARAERLATLFRAEQRRVWGLAYRLTGSAEDADDVVQDAFARLVAHDARTPIEDLGPWLRRVATQPRHRRAAPPAAPQRIGAPGCRRPSRLRRRTGSTRT